MRINWLIYSSLVLCLTYTQAQTKAFKAEIDRHLTNSVPVISVDSLQQNYNNFIILDSRSIKEYNVSHLKDALFVGFKSFKLKNTAAQISKDKPIVIYCSIGYRSEKIAEKLQRKGYKVYNLYGGIFHWKNEELPIYDTTNSETNKIHGFDNTWQQWIINGTPILD